MFGFGFLPFIQCWTFDVRRSFFKTPPYGINVTWVGATLVAPGEAKASPTHDI